MGSSRASRDRVDAFRRADFEDPTFGTLLRALTHPPDGPFVRLTPAKIDNNRRLGDLEGFPFEDREGGADFGEFSNSIIRFTGADVPYERLRELSFPQAIGEIHRRRNLGDGLQIRNSQAVTDEIARSHFAIIDGRDFLTDARLLQARTEFFAAWDTLEIDPYLNVADHGVCRLRRYAHYLLHPNGELQLLPHQAFVQSADNNPLFGGQARNFAPLLPETAHNTFLKQLIRCDFALLPEPETERRHAWEIDVHLYRVLAKQGFRGQPTPEGVHHDGFTYFAVHCGRKANTDGGTSTIYTNEKEPIRAVRLSGPMHSMVVRDSEVMHGVSAFQPKDPAKDAFRDVAVINFIRKPRRDYGIEI